MAERLERVQASGAWQTLAQAEQAEAVAALVPEVKPRSPGVCRG